MSLLEFENVSYMYEADDYDIIDGPQLFRRKRIVSFYYRYKRLRQEHDI